MNMSARVLVVGGGVTAAATARQLREELTARCQISVWDKARGAGGRTSTSRGPAGCGSADLGAQYVTITPEYQQNNGRLYTELTSAGVLAPLTAQMRGLRPSAPGTRQMVMPQGSSSLAKYLFSKASVTPEFEQHVSEVTTEGSSCRVSTAGGRQEAFDVVVLTMPTPQILGMGGSLKKSIESDSSLLAGLKGVQYSSRYALGLFFDRPGVLDVPWAASYLSDHPVIRYVSVDNAKRGREAEATSVVVHTNVKFGSEYVESTPPDVQPILQRHVAELFPNWPQPASVKCQKWRYSQVTRHYPGSPGHVVLCQRPLVVAAGDAFTHPNIDGSLTSAQSVARCVAEYVAHSQPK